MEPQVVQEKSFKVGQELLNLNRMTQWDSGGSCGYCHGTDQSFSWGFTKDTIHAYTYQLMLQKGWRRCGTYFYKPDLKRSCCKMWTHRMNVDHYNIKKDQKKTFRKVLKLLNAFGQGAPEQKKVQKQQQKNTKIIIEKQQKNQKQQQQQKQIPENRLKQIQQISKYINTLILNNYNQFINLFKDKFTDPTQTQKFNIKNCLQRVKFFISKPTEQYDYYSNYLMLIFGSNKKLFKNQYKNTDFMNDIKQWVQNNYKDNQKIQIKVERSGYFLFKFVTKNMNDKQKMSNNPQQDNKEREEKSKNNENKKIQQKEKKQKHQKMEQQQIKNKQRNLFFAINSEQIIIGDLTIRLCPAEVDNQAWEIYKIYCQKIHDKPQKSKSSYKNFLCLQTLNFDQQVTDSKSSKNYVPSWDQDYSGSTPTGKRTKHLGCYHMKYYLKNRLIAIGVVDIMPQCLSSVYFFYHSEFKDYRLGVFSSIIEIEYVKWLQLSFPEFKYYSMGFYVQNCQKMSYKVDYNVSQLLCPITYQFVSVDQKLKQLITKIQKKQINNVRISNQQTAKHADMLVNTDLGVYISQHIKIKHGGDILTLNSLNPQLRLIILQYTKIYLEVMGKKLFDILTFTF